MTTHALTSLPAAFFVAAEATIGKLKPSARPEPAAAVVTMNLRRERLVALSLMIFVMVVPLTLALWFYGSRCRQAAPPCARRRECADKFRSGRYWSSLRRCPCRW